MNNIFTAKRKYCVCRLYSVANTAEYNIVNNKKLEDFFSDLNFYVMKIYNVLKIFELENDFKFSCIVKGGGKTAQADSIRYAIAKCLKHMFISTISDKEQLAEKHKILRKTGLLTVDRRDNWPKHYGRLKSRCIRQRSKR